MEPAERLLTLLGLLQQRASWPAADLAERLGVTTRTVRRDVTRLRSYGYPVDAFAGHGGGYQLGTGGRPTLLLLDEDQALATALGLRLVGHTAVSGLDEGALAALATIERLLPDRLRARLDDLDAVTVADPEPSTAPADRAGFAALARAAAGSVIVRFGYVDQAGEVSARRVEPVRLVHARRRWYLVAYDLDRAGWRTFRVDRVEGVTPTGHRFVARPGPDPAGLVAGVAPGRYRHEATVVVDTPPEEAARVVPAAIATVESCGGPTTLRIGTDDLDWLARYLLGLPWGFEVLDPAALRATVDRLATAIAERHRGRPPPGAAGAVRAVR